MLGFKKRDYIFFIFNVLVGLIIGYNSSTFSDLVIYLSSYAVLITGLVILLYKMGKIHWIMGVDTRKRNF